MLAEAPSPGSGRVTPQIGDQWRGILLRRPGWRAVREVRRHLHADDLGAGAMGHVRQELLGDRDASIAADDPSIRVDLAAADSGPIEPRGQLIVARRDGSLDATAVSQLLARLPALVVVGRLYERVG